MIYGGKGKDYYDSIGYMYGSYNEPPYIDRTPVFEKEPRGFMPYSYSILPSEEFTKEQLRFKSGVVGFCGKIYPHIRVNQLIEKSINRFEKKYEIKDQIYFYEYDDFMMYLEELKLTDRQKRIVRRLIEYRPGESFEDSYRKYFERSGQDAQILFQKEFTKAPYWFKGYSNFDVMHVGSPNAHSAYTLMPNLKQLGFGKILAAEQAYQELEMWLGLDHQEDDDPNAGIEDKYLAAGKGFDCMSFKKRGPKSLCKTKRTVKNK